MNALILAALLACYIPVAGQPMAADKVAHFGAGYVIADFAEFGQNEVLKPLGFKWEIRPIWFSLAAGAIKETYDKNHGGEWDWRDLGCTALGGGAQLCVHW